MAMAESFEGFDAADFQAFLPNKWASNLFNMERMKVRDKMVALGTFLEPHLLALRPFSWEVTPFSPTILNGKRVSDMVLYFTRTADQARAVAPLLDSKISLPDQISNPGEHYQHVTLGVKIDADTVEAGLMVHSTAWLDVMNLLNRTKTPDEAQEFSHMIRVLPHPISIVIAPGVEISSGDFLPSHLKSLEEAILNNQFLIRFGKSYLATDKAIGSAAFNTTMKDLLTSLVHIWEFIAWRPASNYLATDDTNAPVVTSDGSLVQFSTGAKVRIVGGLFDGRVGIVTDIDAKGSCKVLVGRVTVRTDLRSLQAV